MDGFWAGVFGAIVSSVVAGLLAWIFLPKQDGGGPGPEPRVKAINP